jgi:2-isopropylmalate synthase
MSSPDQPAPNGSKYLFTKEDISNLLFDYNMEHVISPNTPKLVKIWDETLRDGEQTPGIFLTENEKLQIAKKLDEIGVAKIAAGFPAVSPIELNSVKQLQAEGMFNATILGVARPRVADIDACLKCGLNEIVLFMPTSAFMMKILHETPESELEHIQNAFDYVKMHGLKFNWVSEDGSRTQPEHLLKVSQLAIDYGAECIVLGDTVGILQPKSVSYIFRMLKEKLRWEHHSTTMGIHTHNDYGLAVANTIAAVLEGAEYAHVCVNGYGERAGNAALEEVALNLDHLGIQSGIELKKLTELSTLVEKIFALPLSAHKPIVGANAFAHESGLHINGILAHPISYEPINPTKVGQRRRFYLGKFSGSGAIVNALQTKLQLSDINLPKEIIANILSDVKQAHEDVSKDEIHKLFDQTKNLMEKIRAGITDEQFFAIVAKHASSFLKNNIS